MADTADMRVCVDVSGLNLWLLLTLLNKRVSFSDGDGGGGAVIEEGFVKYD